jgi:hypothetical protein
MPEGSNLQHILGYLCVYIRPISLIASNNSTVFLFFFLLFLCFSPVNLYHELRPEVDGPI